MRNVNRQDSISFSFAVAKLYEKRIFGDIQLIAKIKNNSLSKLTEGKKTDEIFWNKIKARLSME